MKVHARESGRAADAAALRADESARTAAPNGPGSGSYRRVKRGFSRFARGVARRSGQPSSFFLAVIVVAAWLFTGPLFHYSDTWQLVINTGTTVVTFLMVFLIQHTQDRDAEEIHIKLDELIRAKKDAQNAVLALEELDDEDLQRLRATYLALGSGSSITVEADCAPEAERAGG